MEDRKRKKTQSGDKFQINTFTRIGLVVTGLIFLLAFLTDGMGAIGRLIDQVLSFALGYGKFVLALALIFIGINSYIKDIETKDKYLILTGLGLVLVSTLLFDSVSAQRGVYIDRFSISRVIRSVNGGILGGFLNSIFLQVIGPIGLNIFIFLAILVLIKFFFDLDYQQTYQSIRSGFVTSKDKLGSLASKTKDQAQRAKQGLEEGYKHVGDSIDKKKDLAMETTNFLDIGDQGLQDQELISSYEIFPVEEDPLLDKGQGFDQKFPNNQEQALQTLIDDYQAPPLSLLKKNRDTGKIDKKAIADNSRIIEETMANFSIDAKVSNVTAGPTVTRYELIPAPDVRLSKIVGLADNLAFSLASSGIRIEAPIPGKRAVGIEVPNSKNSLVSLEELLNSEEFMSYKGDLPLVLGRDVSGSIVIDSINDMPHLLIAGATGSGKSVCINAIILSLIYKSSPKNVRLILIDPKIVELSAYNVLPHLLIPVVTNPKKAASTLAWAVEEMERRYQKFSQAQVKDIKDYNNKFAGTDQVMAKIVIIIDELADLMMVASSEVEDYISRLAQMARAAGMHLILATQRPSVDVITGVIKANIPSRISFAVSSSVDSRTILDESGAENLLGKGDMLFYPGAYPKPRRIQGAFVSQGEIDKVLAYVKGQNYQVTSVEDIEDQIENVAQEKEAALDTDPLFKSALKLVVYDEQASISYIQRKLRVGYNRAARMIDEMEEAGFIGPANGSKPRDIYITEEDYLKILGED